MTRTMLLFSVSILLGMDGQAAEQDTPLTPSFRIVIATPLASFDQGSPIPLVATMTNISNRSFLLAFGQRIPEFGNEVERMIDIMVYDSEGRRVKETEYGALIYGRRQRFARGKAVCCAKWQPGESYAEEADLAREFDVSRPGTYWVEGRRYDEDSKAILHSNRISFAVVTGARSSQRVAGSFSLGIALSGASFVAGTPVSMTATMVNISNCDMPVLAQHHYRLPDEVPGRLIVRVLDHNGQPVQKTDIGKNSRVEPNRVVTHGRVALTLKPGQKYEEKIDLSKEFDLTVPGSYAVIAESHDCFTGVPTRSNKVEFTLIQ
jgi:hypothetical protein